MMNNAEKQKRYRDKKRNESVTNSNGNSYGGVTAKTLEMVDAACGDAMGRPLTPENVREQVQAVIGSPAPNDTKNPDLMPYPGLTDCDCQMCKNYRAKGKTTEFLNHGPIMSGEELRKISPLARNRVALPGDTDYNGTAGRVQAREDARAKRAQA